MKKIYIIYDARYRYDEGSATIFEYCDSLEEANDNISDYGAGNVIVEYDVDGKTLINPKTIN